MKHKSITGKKVNLNLEFSYITIFHDKFDLSLMKIKLIICIVSTIIFILKYRNPNFEQLKTMS